MREIPDCDCGNAKKGVAFDGEGCVWCWLALNSKNVKATGPRPIPASVCSRCGAEKKGRTRCETCKGTVYVKTCLTCEGPSMKLKWSYGVTTVPERRTSHLPHTLASLKKAGFDRPRLFVDGASDPARWRDLDVEDVVVRGKESIRAWGNWFLALVELYVRFPHYDRFAIFQDDFVTVQNLRGYLDAVPFPEKGYLNLYTFPSNQRKAEAEKAKGWFLSNQNGRGAVGLVFSQAGVQELLSSRHLAERPTDVDRGHLCIDGGIVTAMKKAGWQEWVHNPSLIQHTGLYTTLGPTHPPQKLSESFPGEGFDAMDLLKNK